jgi:hypothetical protein
MEIKGSNNNTENKRKKNPLLDPSSRLFYSYILQKDIKGL